MLAFPRDDVIFSLCQNFPAVAQNKNFHLEIHSLSKVFITLRISTYQQTSDASLLTTRPLTDPSCRGGISRCCCHQNPAYDLRCDALICNEDQAESWQVTQTNKDTCPVIRRYAISNTLVLK